MTNKILLEITGSEEGLIRLQELFEAGELKEVSGFRVLSFNDKEIEESHFEPNWTSPPGDTISDLMGEMQLSFASFKKEMGFSFEETKSLIRGEMEISPLIAEKLENIFGFPQTFWIKREEQYRQDLLRLSTIE